MVLVSLLAATAAPGTEPRRGQWFPEARFGVMFHFLAGTQANLDRRMEGFDVKAVARQLHEIGADYLILTLGQNCGFYCSPNETYARYVRSQPGERLATRDLPMELADALDTYGIRLILYLPMRSPQRDPVAMERLGDPGQLKDAPPEFTKRWSNVIREWSLRYGEKVSGWWFDGAYNTTHLDDPDADTNWKTFAAACRAGNHDSILGFNPGTRNAFRRMTEEEDYTAGEQNEWGATPADRPAPEGVYWHVLSYMGTRWGRRDGPRTTAREMTDYIATVNAQGGVVTIDVGISPENGTIIPSHYEQLLEIGTALGMPEAGERQP